jgi:hypothetical protein
MNALNIISGLVRSFISYKGEILTSTEIVKYKKQKDKTYLITNHGSPVIADKVIFAAGKGVSGLTNDAIKTKTVLSPLLVVYPKVCSSNMVRLTPFLDKTINHLQHTINGKDYSLIGGGYFADAEDENARVKAGEKLMERALDIFPALKNARVKEIYFGSKTEAVSSKIKRNYLYHIIPIEKNIYTILPGKFSLAFSLAVTTYLRVCGHYPNTFAEYDSKIDISEFVGLMKHKSIVDNIINLKESPERKK